MNKLTRKLKAWLLVPALLATAVLATGCGKEAPQPKRTQTVKLLPDTPPPPPPAPKPEDKPPPPKPTDKPPPASAQPKPEQPPQQQALRSDEAAGTGPGNGLVAGNVSQDYTDQKVGAASAPTIGGGAPAPDSGVNRMVLMAYANATTRSLNEFLARERELKRQDYQIRVDLWLTPAGATQRAELVGSTGDATVDRVLREALQRFPGAASALPERLPQPIRLMVSNRMMG